MYDRYWMVLVIFAKEASTIISKGIVFFMMPRTSDADIQRYSIFYQREIMVTESELIRCGERFIRIWRNVSPSDEKLTYFIPVAGGADDLEIFY